MDKDVTSQLLVYSIVSSLSWQKKFSTLLEQTLGIAERKELENKIKELEEGKKELESSIESLSRVKALKEEENKTLKDSKKFLEKENKRLNQENTELLSEKNLFEARLNEKEEDK